MAALDPSTQVEAMGMTILRACAACGRPSPNPYCDEHQPKPWSGSKRKQGLTVSGWEEQRRAKRILARDMHCCHICGGQGATEVDHVIPLAEGGADDEATLAGVHESCHREKTARESEEARCRR